MGTTSTSCAHPRAGRRAPTTCPLGGPVRYDSAVNLLLLLACTAPDDKVGPPRPDADTSADTAPADTDTGPVDTDETADGTDTADTDTADTDTGDPRVDACVAMSAAAEALLAALTPEQADAIRFELLDPSRGDWSNLPVPTRPRDGVQVGQMSEAAAAAAWALLEASLSEVGYRQARDIVALDDYVPDDEMLGSEYYTWAIYGTPSATDRWAWQFDGHHLVYDFTVQCLEVKMAPTLLGAEPLEVPDGDMAGLRALGAEQDEAFALLDSLDAAQRRVAVESDADMPGLVSGPGSNGNFPEARGLTGAEMTADQRLLFESLLERWVEDQDEPYAALRMAEVVAELDATSFSWIGGEIPESLYYYRIQGPTVWIEFDCAGGWDHAHAVYRDPVGDYGGDVLAAHYAREAHPWAP